MNDAGEVLRNVGAVAGIMAIFWNFVNLVRSYLKLDFSIEEKGRKLLLLKMSLENSAVWSKRIHYAAILAAPEQVSLAEAVSSLGCSTASVRGRNSFVRLYQLGFRERMCVNGVLLVPLGEIFGEQSRIGPNEKIGHAVSVETDTLKEGLVYIARVIVYISYWGMFLRWRYTATAFVNAPVVSNRPRAKAEDSVKPKLGQQ